MKLKKLNKMALIFCLILILTGCNNIREELSQRNNEANKQEFATKANILIEAANTYFMSQNLAGNSLMPTVEGQVVCISATDLITKNYFDEDNDNYKGRVLVKKVGSTYIYSVSLHNDKFMVINEGFDKEGKNNESVVGDNVKDYNKSIFPESLEKCTGSVTFPNERGKK